MFLAQRRLSARKTLYDILGVSQLAKSEEIRCAYLDKAKVLHPDVAIPLDTTDEFRQVQEAYATLSNSWKRTLYDQDLQFQSAVAMTGSVSSSSEIANWRDNYNLESPEARIARRERYKRYAAGERNDLPPVSLTTKQSLGGLFLVGVALTWVCAKAPEWFGGQGELTFHDPVSDDKSVPLVRAFFNPITRKWERLGEGQDAPSFEILRNQYKRLTPKLIDRWEYEQRQGGNDVSNIDTLTVTSVPKTKTSPASVFLDENGVVSVNRRSLHEAISKFLERI